MKKIILLFSIVMLIASEARLQDVTFPRQLTNEGSVLTMFQPQVDSWESYKRLHYRMAFALQPKQGEEVMGVLYMSADTEANMETHRVVIYNFSTTKVNFPSLDVADVKKMEDLIATFMSPDRTLLMSTEQIVACTPKNDSARTIVVNNNPPLIFTSKKPTILLAIEGEPVKAAAGKENLEYVITPVILCFLVYPTVPGIYMMV